MKKNIIISVFLIVFVIISPDFSFSQKTGKQKAGNPELNGQDFILNSMIPSPFISTKLNSTMGFATSLKTEVPLLRLNDSNTSLNVDADISYVNGNVEYQNAITDWAAMWINFSGVARLGTNTVSVLATGVTANTSFDIGMIFKIKEFKNSIFSSSVKIKNSSSSVLGIYQFIKEVIDSTSSNSRNKLINTYNPLSGTIDLRSAFKPGKAWSVLGYLSGGYGENVDVDETKNRFNYEFGGSATYNLNEPDNIPLSFGAAFKLNSNSPTLQYTKRITQNYMFQIAYTGKKDFLISLESNYFIIPSPYKDITLNLTSFNFSWAYFF